MDRRVVSVSVSSDPLLVIPSHDLCSMRSEDWYPVYFGVSCAFFALRLLSGRGCSLQEEGNDGRLTEVCDKVLRASAQLFGVLVWKSQKIGFDEEKREIRQKLEAAEKGLEELRRVRREDAKANEKVVGIFAAQEQRWFAERRRLQQRVGSLVNEIRTLVKEKEVVVSKLTGKIKELEDSVHSKEKSLEEEKVKVVALEEKLRVAEVAAEDLRERAKCEAQENSSKIWKHKTAFIELVSNQRRIEAELDRALRQVEATKREFESVFAQKEESASMVRKLSSELMKMQKDAEQKDKVLSAMLRKSRLDADEKQLLMKEAKSSKSKKKQSEFEADRLKFVSETKDMANSLLRNSLKLRSSSHSQGTKNSRSQSNDFLEYDNRDYANEIDRYSAIYSRCSPEDYRGLDDWVRLEAEKYARTIEQRHGLEVDALIEQMRVKDEKLEEFRWRLLSMEIESKRLNSQVDSHSIMTVEVRETPAVNMSKAETSPYPSQSSRNPPWKMDLQALGVFYKIRRLKQQLVMLERLIGKQESSHDADGTNARLHGMKNFLSLIAILNKQVGRYQSLQERTDDLCKRKHDKSVDVTHDDSDVPRTNSGRTKELEVFLEETFQLQRHMVATGQKMMEIQSKVTNSFLGSAEQVEKSININVRRFCDGLRTLFRDVQGGLEVRIARIIGDLEGTLACDGMIHLR